MTQKELIEVTEGMLPEVVKDLKATIKRLVKSGAIDVESCNNLYEAKAILCAALSHEVDQWRPKNNVPTAEEKNLRRFC